jgi:hypothetical protein
MRCSDNNYYIVKFQNNPQGKKVLANELFGALLAKRLDLPVAEPSVVDVSESLIRLTDEMVFISTRKMSSCQPGLSFGSRYISEYPLDAFTGEECNTFLTRDRVARVTNLSDFVGMLVFDRWTSNNDSRQVVFVRNSRDATWKAHMIDQGMCFGGAKWNFPDILRMGVHFSESVYESITGIDEFEPLLDRIEHEIDETVLEQLASQVPPEWYDDDVAALRELVATLNRRRGIVRKLLQTTREDYPRLFPNWIDRRFRRLEFAAQGQLCQIWNSTELKTPPGAARSPQRKSSKSKAQTRSLRCDDSF